MLKWDAFDILTFDCYGTLIDWEAGILEALRGVLRAHDQQLPDEQILELYAQFEAEAESGGFMRYRDVLRCVMMAFASHGGFSLDAGEEHALAESVKHWPTFPDTVESLRRLRTRYRLAILSNIDDDLFAGSAPKLGVEFDYIITAQQVGSYKPAPGHFEEFLRRWGGPKERVLHVAQSLYHDIAPANRLGWRCAWVNRRAGREGSGATAPAQATPDLTVTTLRELAEMAVGGG